MIPIKTTPEFDKWLDSIKDHMTLIRLARRLDRAQQGNLGDVRQLNNDVFEMREHFGPGWRMYYVKRGEVLIVSCLVAAINPINPEILLAPYNWPEPWRNKR